MKYFVYAYNYVTLFKAFVYAKEEWGFGNTYFIYTTLVAKPPAGLIKENYNVHIVDPNRYKHNVHIKGLLTLDDLKANKKTVQEFFSFIIENAPNAEEEINIVVFRDTRIRETILIDLVKKKYLNVKIIMIEEGLGLYAKTEIAPHSLKNHIKSIIYHLAGVPPMALYHLPHGIHPSTDQIICSRPEALKNTELDKGNNLIKEIPIFTKEHCDDFIQEVLMEDIPEKTYNYVFLTQPLFPSQNQKQNEKYDNFMKELIATVVRHGKLLIKPHPRDKWDYLRYARYGTDICPSEYSKIAFELLAGHFGNPQAITLFSSAAYNGANIKPAIFLFDFFQDMLRVDLFDIEFIKANGIIRCGTFEEVENALSKIV